MKSLWTACLVVTVVLWAAACSGSDSPTGGPSATGKGVCAESCPKSCAADEECDISDGELCCDFGSAFGKACVPARRCPRFCTADADCRGDEGEACCRTLLTSEDKICVEAQECLVLCTSNDDCGEGDDEICCQNLRTPTCVPPVACGGPCTTGADCSEENPEEFCCTSIPEPWDAVYASDAVCVAMDFKENCPTTCQESADCEVAEGEVCCPDGRCRRKCEEECEESVECDMQEGELCCRNGVIASPWFDAEN